MPDDEDDVGIPEGYYLQDDLDGGRLAKKPIVFTNCNVCGIKLRTEEEYEMGMCERCSNEYVPVSKAGEK